MPPAAPSTRFVSLRWRFLLPLFLALLVATMIAAYWLGHSLTINLDAPQANLVIQNSKAVAGRVTALYEQNRLEAQRIAFTSGVTDAVRQHEPQQLQTLLESSARLANLDNVIVTDTQGIEVVGLLRVEKADGSTDYTVSTGTNLHDESVFNAVQNEGYIGATELARTPEGLILYTAVPITDANGSAGIAIVGERLGSVLDTLNSGGLAQIALYGVDNSILQTTLKNDSSLVNDLILPDNIFDQSLKASQQVAVRNVELGSHPYQAAYFPLQFGPQILGVVGVIIPDNTPFLTGMGQQLTGLTLAAVTAAIVIGLFWAVSRMLIRPLNRVNAVASALAAGNSTARTGMKRSDEVSAVGQALDQYADYVQERQDGLRVSLRRQRRETEYLLAVLESVPDGIVVQDMDGRVVVMNEHAKTLLGKTLPLTNLSFYDKGEKSASRTTLGEMLTAAVTDKLGVALAPGLYAMGDPKRIELDGKMLSAQAAAVTDLANERIGTVVVLHDITHEVWRQRAQEAIFTRIEQEAQQSLSQVSQSARTQQPIQFVARELARHAMALQKLVVEMREITMPDTPGIQEGQRPLRLETLVWAIANEWRQVASAANLGLDVLIAHRDLYVLGDERRLRWAIGNIVDNAIKYTLPGGKLILEIRGEADGKANLRIRDSGVGIALEELPNVFTRFYRGTPTTADGYVLRVPGMGQGLSITKQIIEAHGGMIQIKSKVGIGTAVYFTVPLTASVGMELPRFPLDVDMEGETLRLREDDI